MSRLAAAEDHKGFSATMDWGEFLSLLVGLPAAVALFLLAEPLSAAIYLSVAGGAMSALDIRMVALALELFAIALPGFVLVKILAPGFFAHQNTQAPFRYATVAVAVNLVGSVVTFTWFGHVGLALATALSAWAHVFLLLHGLRQSGHYIPGARLLRQLLAVTGASVMLGIVVWLWVVPIPWMAMAGLPRLGWMLLAVMASVIVYAVGLLILGLRPRDLIHRV